MADTEFSGSILTELHHRLEDLPKALGRVAQYVLTNPEKVVHQSLVEVSQHSGSGQASVIRLAQSLGLDGYGAFKLALNTELSRCDATMVTDGSAVHQIAGTLVWRFRSPFHSLASRVRRQKRWMLARISSAVLVQRNGFGSALVVSI